MSPTKSANRISALHLIGVNPNKLGALEAYALAVSRELLRNGHGSMVGFLDLPPSWMMEMFRKEGVEVVAFDPRAKYLSSILSLRRWIRTREITIVHVTFYNIYSPLFFAATAGTGACLIYSDQVSRVTRPERGIKSALRFLKARLLQTGVRTIVADSEFIRDWQIRHEFARPEKVEVIFNGADQKRFRKTSDSERKMVLDEFQIPHNAKLAVSIAQLIPYKGLDVLLHAAEIVLGQRNDVHFLIVGDGPDRAFLETAVTNRGIAGRVCFAGSRVDTERILGATDIFVLLSVWREAFAFSLLEAMAAECAVVATRIGAIPESVVDGKTGLLVPPHDPPRAAEALLTLLNQDNLRSRMGRAGRARVEALFTLHHWVEQTIQLYERLLRAA